MGRRQVILDFNLCLTPSILIGGPPCSPPDPICVLSRRERLPRLGLALYSLLEAYQSSFSYKQFFPFCFVSLLIGSLLTGKASKLQTRSWTQRGQCSPNTGALSLGRPICLPPPGFPGAPLGSPGKRPRWAPPGACPALTDVSEPRGGQGFGLAPLPSRGPVCSRPGASRGENRRERLLLSAGSSF